jgi:hypothetical protein
MLTLIFTQQKKLSTAKTTQQQHHHHCNSNPATTTLKSHTIGSVHDVQRRHQAKVVACQGHDGAPKGGHGGTTRDGGDHRRVIPATAQPQHKPQHKAREKWGLQSISSL